MSATVKAVSVRVFELFARDGTTLGLFKADSDWNGMRKLVSMDGKKQVVIVDCAESVFDHVFRDVFGEHRAELRVVKASPDMISTIERGTTSAGVPARE